MKVFIKFFTLFIFTGSLFSYEIPRFYDPKGRKLTTYEEWKAKCTTQREFKISKVYETKAKKKTATCKYNSKFQNLLRSTGFIEHLHL